MGQLMRAQIFLLTIALLGMHAEQASGTDYRHADAHKHGKGILNIVLEGNTLLIELEAPGADIIGFEHTAKTATEKKAVNQALAYLEDPLTLFRISKEANCKLKASKLNVGKVNEETEGNHAHELREREHREEHGKHHNHKDDESHNEVRAQYTLNCTNLKALRSIDFQYFSYFKAAKMLQVNLISSISQTSFEVYDENPILKIREGM